MTNCYTCGHEILEGQKTTDEVDLGAFFSGDPSTGYAEAHKNPADHLPTLDVNEQARSLADSLVGARILKERTRAAERVRGLVRSKWADRKLPDVGDLNKLADEIESGE